MLALSSKAAIAAQPQQGARPGGMSARIQSGSGSAQKEVIGVVSGFAQVGEIEGVRWKGYPCKELHAAAFRIAKTP